MLKKAILLSFVGLSVVLTPICGNAAVTQPSLLGKIITIDDTFSNNAANDNGSDDTMSSDDDTVMSNDDGNSSDDDSLSSDATE